MQRFINAYNARNRLAVEERMQANRQEIMDLVAEQQRHINDRPQNRPLPDARRLIPFREYVDEHIRRAMREALARGRRPIGREREGVLREWQEYGDVDDVLPKDTIKCPMCNKVPQMQHFLKHFFECPNEKTVSEDKKAMVLHQYQSCDYVLQRMLKQLRFDLELAYYKALKSDAELINMECVKCDSFKTHMTGGCYDNHQLAVFEMKADQIRSKILSHFEAYLCFKKEIGYKEIEDKHHRDFQSVSQVFEDNDACDAETEMENSFKWQEFRETTVKNQTNEKRNYIYQTDSQHRLAFEKKEQAVEGAIIVMALKMAQAITTNRRNAERRYFPLSTKHMIHEASRELAMVVTEDERREIQERKRLNRRAQQETAAELGVAPAYVESRVSSLRDLAAAAGFFNFGPVEDHENLRRLVENALVEFEDTDDDNERNRAERERDRERQRERHRERRHERAAAPEEGEPIGRRVRPRN